MRESTSFGGRAIGGCDRNGASSSTSIFRARFFNQRANNFTAWSNDVANLVRLILILICAVRAARFLRGRPAAFVPSRRDEQAALLCLLQSLSHDLRIHAGNLNVHLQRSDAFTRSRHFEIHVAIMIFSAGDVRKDRVLLPSMTRPIATPATGAFIGTPASNSARVPPHTLAIDDDPFDSVMSETMRIV